MTDLTGQSCATTAWARPLNLARAARLVTAPSSAADPVGPAVTTSARSPAERSRTDSSNAPAKGCRGTAWRAGRRCRANAPLPAALCVADARGVRVTPQGPSGSRSRSSETLRVCHGKHRNAPRPAPGKTCPDPRETPPGRALLMRSSGLEPPRAVKPTRPSTLRVYQFRHERRVREYSLARVARCDEQGACRHVIRRRRAGSPKRSHAVVSAVASRVPERCTGRRGAGAACVRPDG